MAKLTRAEREQIAARRIINVLKAQRVANLRTLEQKISDAGPNPLRVQPHILTPVKKRLVQEGRIIQVDRNNAQWLSLSDDDPQKVDARRDELLALWSEFTARRTVVRTGQALEIAIYRAIVAAPGVINFGGFENLDAHDDATAYTKRELHEFNGKTLGDRALDFIVAAGGDYCGIEAKNIRPWLYPHDAEVRAAIGKAVTLDVVPVLIARRIAYVTFHVLGTCGVIIHQTFNQLMASADAGLAAQVRDKHLLGYHDVRTGNLPDARLTRFISEHLPALVPEARKKFDRYHDLLQAFAEGMDYKEFAARVRRREAGQNEDRDPGPDDEDRDPYD